MKTVMKFVCGLTAAAALGMPQMVLAEGNAFTMDYDNFQEIVLVDDENCMFKITGAELGENYVWSAQLENRGETELMFSMSNVSVNGYMCDPYWAVSVAAGEVQESMIEWWSDTLELNGITHAEEIEFDLRVYDNENWGEDDLLKETFFVECSCEEEPSGYAAPEQGIVLADNGNIFLIANGPYVDEEWGETVFDIYVENKTDMNLYVSLTDVCVNGFECDPYWAGELRGNTKMFTSCRWYPEVLEEYGISDIYQVDGYVRAYNEEDWEMDDLAYEPFVIYPYGEEGVQEQSRVTFENEKVLLDNEYCTMVIGGFAQDEYSYYAKLYLENKTDSSMMFALEDVMVDGQECDPYWADTVPAGKKGYSDLTWYGSDFQDLGIDTPTSIEGHLHIYDDDNYDTEDYYNGAVILLGEGEPSGVEKTEVEMVTEVQTEPELSPYEDETFMAEVEAEFRAVVEDPSALENASEFVYAVVSCMCGNGEMVRSDENMAPIVAYLETKGYDLSASARNYMEDLGISRRECMGLKAALGR